MSSVGAPVASALDRALAAVKKAEARQHEPLAIVGLGCRFPGAADEAASYWRLLENGVDAVREIPAQRWPRGSALQLRGARFAGLLDGIDAFEPEAFGISPREAKNLDPQQRLMLEVAWEAFEDAGQNLERLSGSKTGTFVGLTALDYRERVVGDPAGIDAYAATGNMICFAAGRLAYVFGLEGPALAVDTACSSSLAAVHLACRSLRAGECDLALAGGVNLILSPLTMRMLLETQSISPDGRCRTFDTEANGFVRGEGAGAIVLKRLSDAQRDGDRIWALIRGSALNQDGRSTGLTTPNVRAQQALLTAALRDARVAAGEVSYLEAHGTGTSLGDPIEVEALKAVFGQPRADGSRCWLGSVKTNLGHLEAAAGVAGLIKVVLALHHEKIPRHLNFRQLNPRISFADTAFAIPLESVTWPRGERPRVAGVSSFGLSGTNAHVLLAEAPQQGAREARDSAARVLLLPISAHSAAGLAERAAQLETWLGSATDADAAAAAFTASRRHAHRRFRSAVVGGSALELRDRLQALKTTLQGATASTGCAPVFVFSGQGAQWPGMGTSLLAEEPVFRDTMERCDALFARWVNWSLLAELARGEEDSSLRHTALAQPAGFALQVSLAALLASWGVKPAALVGHSLGEISAAAVSGALSLEDAARLVVERGRLMQSAAGRGKMISVYARAEELESLLAQSTGTLSVAAWNGPTSVVLSGDTAAIEAAAATLAARGIKCRALHTDVAFHCAHMDPLVSPLVSAASGLAAAAPGVPWYSSVEAARLERVDAEYWGRNLREPVRFAESIAALIAEGKTQFVEIGAHPVLGAHIDETLTAAGRKGLVVPTLRRGSDGRSDLLRTVAALYGAGAELSFEALFPNGRVISLPPYPFQRQRHWVHEPASVLPSSTDHPLLGQSVLFDAISGASAWRQRVALGSPAYLAEHRLEGAPLFPAAGYIEMALSALTSAAECRLELEDLELRRALFLIGDAEYELDTRLAPTAGALRVTVSSAGTSESAAERTVHATLTARRLSEQDAAVAGLPSFEAIHGRCQNVIEGASLYAAFERLGFQYGTAFRTLRSVRHGKGEALGELVAPESAFDERYFVHPGLLDGALQVAFVAAGMTQDTRPSSPFVPTHFARVRWFERPPARLLSHATLRSPSGARSFEADITLLTPEGRIIARIDGLRLQCIEQPAASDARLLRHDWQPSTAAPGVVISGEWLIVAGQAQDGEALRMELARRGARAVVCDGSPAALLELLDEHDAFQGVVYWAPPSSGAPPSRDRRVWGSALSLVQAVTRRRFSSAPRLWLVTTGVFAIGSDDLAVEPSHAALWGFGRCLAYETPELECTRVDLSPSRAPGNVEELAIELLAGHADDEVALRGGRRFVGRLVRGRVASGDSARRADASGLCFRLAVAEAPGPTYEFREIARREPGRNEIEVQVATAVLHGAVERSALEVCGRVLRVGPDVSSLEPGQWVSAFANQPLASHLTIPASQAVGRPERWSTRESALLTLSGGAAHYVLHELGGLRQGERVLLVGSRSPLSQMMRFLVERAGGRAELVTPMDVEALVNALAAGEPLDAGQAENTGAFDIVCIDGAAEVGAQLAPLLARGGRMLLLNCGAPESWPARLRDGSFALAGIDWERLVQQPPARFQRALRQTALAAGLGELPPPEHEALDLTEVHSALHAGRSISEVVIELSGSVPVVRDAELLVRSDASYVISGGLGGLGLSAARWLASRGARHLVLLGRHGVQPGAVQRQVEALRSEGVSVTVGAVDVAERLAVEELLATLRESGRAIRGVIHAAGIVDDALLEQQSIARFESVLRGKADGALNLDAATRDQPLDFFVVYSSAASLLGSPGQANYAAANAVADAVVRRRNREGLPALSLHWGAFGDVGMAANVASRAARLARSGMRSLTVEEAEPLLAQLLAEDVGEIGVVPLDARQWLDAHPQLVSSKLFSSLFAEAVPRGESARRPLLDSVLSAPADARQDALERCVREQVAEVLLVKADRIERGASFRSLGLDSLMVVELKNRLSVGLGVELPATLIWIYPSLAALCEHLARTLGLGATVAVERDIGEALPERELERELGALSAEGLMAELEKELARS